MLKKKNIIKESKKLIKVLKKQKMKENQYWKKYLINLDSKNFKKKLVKKFVRI